MRALFTPLFLLELSASIIFIMIFGFGDFLLFILSSMFFGIILLGIFWKNILAFQVADFKSMIKQFSFVIAGFLLVFPGILSSILGICIFLFGVIFSFNKKQCQNYSEQNSQNNDDNIIDVEVIEDRK